MNSSTLTFPKVRRTSLPIPDKLIQCSLLIGVFFGFSFSILIKLIVAPVSIKNKNSFVREFGLEKGNLLFCVIVARTFVPE